MVNSLDKDCSPIDFSRYSSILLSYFPTPKVYHLCKNLDDPPFLSFHGVWSVLGSVPNLSSLLSLESNETVLSTSSSIGSIGCTLIFNFRFSARCFWNAKMFYFSWTFLRSTFFLLYFKCNYYNPKDFETRNHLDFILFTVWVLTNLLIFEMSLFCRSAFSRSLFFTR